MKSTCFLFVIGLTVTASLGYGNLVAPRSLTDLDQGADLIVVGTINMVSQADTTLNLSLRLNRVLKGDPNLSGSLISVDWHPLQHKRGRQPPALLDYGFSRVHSTTGRCCRCFKEIYH